MLYKILSRKKLARNKYGDVDSSYKASSPSVFTPYTTGANSTPPTPQDDPVNFQLTKPTGMFTPGNTNYDTTYLVAMQGNALVPTYVYSVEESDVRLSTVIRDNGTTHAYLYMVGSSSMTDDGNVLITSYFEAPTYDEATYTYTYTGPVGQVYYNYHMGSAGQDGLNNAVVHIYKRAAIQPATPTSSITTVYHFSTMVLDNPPTGWSTEIPANDGNPCWVSAAAASSTHDAVILSGNIWATPVNAFENGEDGQDGTDGINTATVYIYKRSPKNTTPTKPSVSTIYTFGTGGLSPIGVSLGGWVQAIEDLPAGNDPIWVSQAVAIGRGATDNIAASEWATPKILASNGADGLQGASVRGPVKWVDHQMDRRFSNGLEGDDPDDAKFIDIVIRVNSSNIKEYYRCTTSFDATPDDEWADVSSNFTIADAAYDFVAADLLLAENAKIQFLSGNEITITYHDNLTQEDTIAGGVKGAASADGVVFWAGSDPPGTAPYRVSYDGTLYATSAYITGEIHATDGIFSGTIKSADGVYKGYLETEFKDIDDDFSGGSYYITTGTQETPGTLNVRVRPASNRHTIYLPPATEGNVGKVCNLWLDPTNFSSGSQGEPTIKIKVSASGINQQVLYLKNFIDGVGISSRFETTYGFETRGGYAQFTCVSHKVGGGTEYYWYVTNMELHEPVVLSE